MVRNSYLVAKFVNRLINELIRRGYLKTDLIIEAFAKVDRIEFVPEELETEAYVNIPLPIGHGQTISQPQTVAIMLEMLGPKPGDKILDVGSGSGWTTALLMHIVGDKGKVTAMDRIEGLLESGKKNVEKFDFTKKGNVSFILGDGSRGYAKESPYDCILVSAAAQEVPEALKKQLKVGGRMVIPVYNDLWFLRKDSENDFYKEEYPGFSFVPLITEKK